jgi:hypothetical protein
VGDPNVTAQLVSVVLVLAGWVAVVAGVCLLAGLAWALIGAGALAVFAGVVLYDPAHARKRSK